MKIVKNVLNSCVRAQKRTTNQQAVPDRKIKFCISSSASGMNDQLYFKNVSQIKLLHLYFHRAVVHNSLEL